MHKLARIGAVLFFVTTILVGSFYISFTNRRADYQSRRLGEGDDHLSKFLRRVGYDVLDPYFHEEHQISDLKYIHKLKQDLIDVSKQLSEMQADYSRANPFRALKAYSAPELKHFNAFPGNSPLYSSVYMGLKHNPSYCDIVDTYNLYNPENVFENKNFVGDYNPTSLVKEHVFNVAGKDVMPDTGMSMKNFSVPHLDLDITATAFFTKRVSFHNFYKIGKNFLCTSQMYNHIPGHGILTRKDMNVGMVNDYAKRYENNTKCFNKKMYFPYAYRLDNYTECVEFFKELHSEEYAARRQNEPITFIIKKGYGAHRASGIFVFDMAKEEEIRALYNEGEKCGRVSDPLLAQLYIANPLVLDKKNKFDFRIYMLIASVDPMIVYYHDGFLRVSLQSYDKNSSTKSVHFTNTHLSKALFKRARDEEEFNGMNETELRDYQMWTMNDLQDYLIESKQVKNDKWLDEYLRPQFKQAYLHTVRMARHSFFKHSGVFEMFGLDFLLDENLNLWFIECNASPQLVGTNEYKTEFLSKMLQDMFEIQYSYLRSRWSRINKLMKKYHEMVAKNNKAGLVSLQDEFAKINMNYLEPEFQIPKTNSWTLIMDENIKGKGAYLGILKDECIDDA